MIYYKYCSILQNSCIKKNGVDEVVGNVGESLKASFLQRPYSCMISIQPAPWSRCWDLEYGALRWLSLLGGFEQAANLRGRS